MNSESKLRIFQETVLATVRETEASLPCRIALVFRDAADPALCVFHRHRERFHAASTMKAPVMIEVFRQAEKGRFSLDDEIDVNPNFLSMHDGSPFETRGCDYVNGRIGGRERIRKLVEQMIVVSDDLAANLLITLCGAENITKTAQALGATQTTVLRCVEDLASFRAGGMNWVTAEDLAILFEAIQTNRAASPEACAAMLEILLRQEIRNVIPARLPDGTPVANKTGAITGSRHDAGIVYAPFGAYYLVLLCDGLKDGAAGVEALAKISRIVYDERAKI